MRLLSRSLALAVLAAGAVLANVSQSQVIPAIKGGGSQINVYGLYAGVNPNGSSTLNYPQGVKYPSGAFNTSDWNEGGSVGADFRLGRLWFGQPAIGARITFSTSSFGKENTYMFGPEMHYVFGKLRPYGDFLLGKGDITYKNSAGQDGFTDDSVVFEPGAGVDYHLNHRFSVRLFDFQYQFWNLGTHTYPANGTTPSQTFATKLEPWSLSVGVLVRIP
jgi:hypothetical protein